MSGDNNPTKKTLLVMDAATWERRGSSSSTKNHNDWILRVPGNRLKSQSGWRPRPVTVVTVLAGLLVSYVVAPPVLWLTGRVEFAPMMTTPPSSTVPNDSSFYYSYYNRAWTLWIFETVPQIASALLALQISLCFMYVGLQHYLNHYNYSEKSDAKSKKTKKKRH